MKPVASIAVLMALLIGCKPAPVAVPPAKVAKAPVAPITAGTDDPLLNAEETDQGDTDADAPATQTDTAGLTNDDTTSEEATEPSLNNDVDATDSTDVESENTIQDEAQNETRIPHERIMLLTERGPLVIDLHIKISGEHYVTSFDAAMQKVFAIADDDNDGRVSWEDIMAHPRFAAGQFGNPATTTYQAQQDMTRLYDTTQNGRVDKDELVRYLTSNQSTSRPMALYTSNYRRVQNRDDSPVRKWLDTNDDLVIDAAEIEGAYRRIRLRDVDDDEILLASDFLDPSTAQPGQGMRRRVRDSEYLPSVGWEVRDGEPWSDMRVAWNHFYGVGQDVRASDLVIGATMYSQIDLDKSDYLDNLEMEMLAEVEPHLAFEIDLVAREAGQQPDIKMVAMRLPNEQLNAVVQHQSDRVTIQLPDTNIDIFARDTIGYSAFDTQADSYLQQADGDSNDYIDEDEFGAIAQFFQNLDFDAVDFDGNEKLFREEIIEALEQRSVVSRNQIRIKADDQDDALWPSLDLNSDGRLDSREIADIDQSLLALDNNGDGELHLHELRGAMVLGVVRGGGTGPIFQGDTTFQIPAVARKSSQSSPRWFNGMDRNRDASLSWREFIGSREQFEELDKDSDGFISVSEVEHLLAN